MNKRTAFGGLASISILAVVIFFVTMSSQLFTSVSGCTPTPQTTISTTATPGSLPGEQRWAGTSSLLFGANDASWDWSPKNMGNNPAIAATVKDAGITVIRTTLTASDADRRVAAIEQAGALCLGILRPQDAAQVVQILGKRCNLYEWRNEPDNEGISVQEYSRSWNQAIPSLRALNPHAAFIGPVVSYANLPFIQTFLQLSKKAGTLPDAVSYHMYPCVDLLTSACLQHLNVYQQSATQVASVVQQVVGHPLPQAVTEWNYSWKPAQTPNKSSFMQQFSQASLQAMAQAGIAIANQFDIASNAGYGSLDMIDPLTGRPYTQLTAMKRVIMEYQTKAGIFRPREKIDCQK
jgi:hypothetical protein